MNCPTCEQNLEERKIFTVERCPGCGRYSISIHKLHSLYVVYSSISERKIQRKNLKITQKSPHQKTSSIPFWYDHSSKEIKSIIPFTSNLLDRNLIRKLIINDGERLKIDNSQIVEMSSPISYDSNYDEVLLYPVYKSSDSRSEDKITFYDEVSDETKTIPPTVTRENSVWGWIVINILNFILFVILSFFMSLPLTLLLLLFSTIVINLVRMYFIS